MGGRPGGASSFGACFGALSWHIDQGHADGVDLSALRTVLSIRYLDRVQPSTPWDVVLYVDESASGEQRAALADIFLGRAGGTVARLYGPAPLRLLATVYVEFFRGIPVLLLLYFLYYGLASMSPAS